VRRVKKLNPLTNTRAMLRLNPYAAVLKRAAILTAQKRQHARDLLLAEKRGVSITITCFAILYKHFSIVQWCQEQISNNIDNNMIIFIQHFNWFPRFIR